MDWDGGIRIDSVQLIPLVIHGAGGHGIVVAEAAAASGFSVLGFVDDAMTAGFLGGFPILGPDFLESSDAELIVAIGDESARSRIQKMHEAAGRIVASVIHPSAVVSPSAVIGPGVFVGSNAVVNAKAKVAKGSIVNSRAVVEHHCRVGAYSHIAPGTTLGGIVQIGDFTLVGIGASVLPGVSIGSHCVVGAGSVVRDDVEDGCTVVGSPAKLVS